jgi:tetratricopeptide (TPR) repeat protein
VLEHYKSLAYSGAVSLGHVSLDLRKVIRAADRWRAHDPAEGSAACELAADILARLGQRDLAWEYRTTALAYKPGEGPNPEQIAANYSRVGEHDLADRAYAVAMRANPTNGMLSWERAMNYQQWGKPVEAQALLKRLSENPDIRERELKQRALWQLQK